MAERKQTEATITKAICRCLKAKEIWHMKLHGSAMQRRGMPDIMGILRGQVFFLEVKRPGGKLTKLQERRQCELRSAGAIAVRSCSVEHVQQCVKHWESLL